MGTCAAAHPEIADPEPVGLATEIEDLRARGHEWVESHGEGGPVTAARIGERHERGLAGGRAIGYRECGDVTLHGGADLAQQRHHGRRSAVTVEPDHIRAGALE